MAKLFDAATVKASLGDKRLKSLQQTYGGKGKGKYDFQFVKTSQLEPGVYRIRFLPPFPGLAKRVPVRLVTHGVEIKMGEKPMNVHCTGEDCLICRLLVVMEPQKDALSDAKQAALKHLSPWERFNFPLAIGGQPDPKDERKYPQWVPDKNVEKGIILIVQADGILSNISKLFDRHPDLSDIEEGRYLKLEKENRNTYNFSEPGNPKPLATTDLYTPDRYPKLDELAAGCAKRMDNSDLEELLKGTWWRKMIPWEDLDTDAVGGAEDAPEDEDDEPPAKASKKKARPVDEEEVAEIEGVDEDDEPPSRKPKPPAQKCAADAAPWDDEDDTPSAKTASSKKRTSEIWDD